MADSRAIVSLHWGCISEKVRILRICALNCGFSVRIKSVSRSVWVRIGADASSRPGFRPSVCVRDSAITADDLLAAASYVEYRVTGDHDAASAMLAAMPEQARVELLTRVSMAQLQLQSRRRGPTPSEQTHELRTLLLEAQAAGVVP